VIELALVHRLASLVWRLHRANAIETGLFEIQGEFLPARPQGPPHRPSQPGTLPTRTLANGHKTVPGSNGRDDPLASNQEPLSTTSTRRRSHHGRSPAPSPNVSCASPIMAQPCLTTWDATKRNYGGSSANDLDA